jgi:hypothetical protein
VAAQISFPAVRALSLAVAEPGPSCPWFGVLRITMLRTAMRRRDGGPALLLVTEQALDAGADIYLPGPSICHSVEISGHRKFVCFFPLDLPFSFQVGGDGWEVGQAILVTLCYFLGLFVQASLDTPPDHMLKT